MRDPNLHVPAYLAPVPPHPESRRGFYSRVIMPLARWLLRRQRIEVKAFGSEFIPTEGGAVLAFNHTGYYDFILGGVPAHLRGGRVVHYMAKKEVFETPVVGTLMRWMHHISVDRSQGAASLQEARDAASSGKLVGIFPESTISRSFELASFKTGAARIAYDAGVPLVPVIIWGSQRIYTKGGKLRLGKLGVPVYVRVGVPVPLSGNAEEDTALLKESMEYMLGITRKEYEKDFGPFPAGATWLPAALGGGAPTLEEAEKIAAAERAARQEGN